MLDFPLSTLSDHDVELCHNLRPAMRGRGLESVPPPGEIPLKNPLPGGRLLPGGSVTDSDGVRWIFIEYSGRLVCHDGRETYALPDAPGRPMGIIRCGDRLLVLMGEEEAPMWLYRTDDGEWTWRSTADLPEPLSIIRNDEETLTASVGGITLRGAYTSRSTVLHEDDADRVEAMMADAYNALSLRVARSRRFFQPVIVRYRMYGADGSALYTSAPVMISAQGGQQLLSADFTLSGDRFATLSEETLSVSTFSLRLRPVAPLSSGWHDVVKRVELIASPQLHPYDPKCGSVCTFGHFTASAGSIRIGLPGVSDPSGSAQGGFGTPLRAMVESVLDALDECLEYIGTARFDAVSGEWEGLEHPFYPRILAPADEIDELRAMIADSREARAERDRLLMSISAPHWLCAAMGAESGDTLAYTGLAARRFSGWLPAEFAIEETPADDAHPADAPVASKVTFADGSSCVRSGVVSGFSFKSLSPLITYPAADAVKIELFYDKNYLSLPLRPSPSGRFSYWLSETGAPVSMERDRPAFVLPVESRRQKYLPGAVAVASVSEPLKPLTVVHTTESAPVALRGAPSDSGGWDAGSARYYLFGRDGTRSLCVAASRTRVTARTLDRRPVECPDAMTPVGNNSIALLAGEDLLQVKGQKVSVLRPWVGAKRLGYDPRRDELLCFHDAETPCPDNYSMIEGNSSIPVFPDVCVTDVKGSLLYTRTSPEAVSLLSDGSRLLMLDTEGRLRDYCGGAETSGTVAVAYRVSSRRSNAKAAREIMRLRLTADGADGMVELRAGRADNVSYSDPVASFTLHGDIVSLPQMQFLLPPRDALWLSLRLECTSLRGCF